MLRVLHIASEIAPYSKTGGLADVTGALPRALASIGHDVVVVSPFYRGIDPVRFALARRLRRLPVRFGPQSTEVEILEGILPGGGGRVRTFLVDHPVFDREGLYGPRGGEDFADNGYRYALLGAAALALCDDIAFRPDVVHGHDWQAGPALVYAAARRGSNERPALVFTIHNLAYHGVISPAAVDDLGLGREHFHLDGFEFYGKVSLLKAGLVLADRITTVSRRYAEEIQQPAYGTGLDGLLRKRVDRLTGVVNGADYTVWDPSRDPYIAVHYDADTLESKRVCKAALQAELGLPVRPRAPLLASISRLNEQKGLDLLLDALSGLWELHPDAQIAVLGAGDPELERRLVDTAGAHATRMAVRIGHDDPLAHRMLAGADLFVMPSRFEPCGLTQMYAHRYGTPPVVRATGGLFDTVIEHDAPSRTGNGFRFGAADAMALLEALHRAIAHYARNGQDWRDLQHRCMSQDRSWQIAAEAYDTLYRRACADRERARAA